MAAETKIVITAATSQAESALKTLGQSVDGVSRQMFDLSGIAGTLAGAFTITAFAGMIKGSIDAADELNNLSIKTGTSVEQLAGLKFAAEQSDTSLQAVAGAAKKLSTNIAENPAMFKKFGVDAKDSTGALIQLADIFQAMPDGVEKTALSVKLMGKSGEEMIPFLNQGGAAIAALYEEGKIYNKVSTESARLSADFNDNLDKLKASASGAGMSLSMAMLPALNNIITQTVRAQKEYGTLFAMFAAVGLTGASVLGVEIDPQKRAQAELNDMLKEQRDLRKDILILEARPKVYKDLQDEEINNLKKRLSELSPKIKDQIDYVNAPINEAGAAAAKARLAAEANADAAGKGRSLMDALGGSETTKPKADPNAATVISMQNEEFRKQMELLGVASEQVKVYELAMNGATKAQIEEAQASADSIGIIKAKLEAEKQAKKQAEDSAKGGAITGGLKKDFELDIAKKNRTLNDVMMSAADKQHADNLDALSQRAARAVEEISKLNVSEEERARLVAVVTQAEVDQKQKMEELRVQVEKNTASWQYGANVAMRNYLDEISNVAKQSESLFTKAFKGMEDALVKFVRTGKMDFSSLADNIINDLIRIQIQQSTTQPLSAAMNSGGGIINMFSSLFGGGSSSPATTATGQSYSLSSGGSSFGLSSGNSLSGISMSGARASGGPVNQNSLYRVNENGPEMLSSGGNDYLMMGGKDGFVTPLSQGGKLGVVAQGAGGAQVSLQVNVINNASQQVSATAQQNSSGGFDLIIEQIESKIANNVSRGTGTLSNVMSQTFGLNRAAGALR